MAVDGEEVGCGRDECQPGCGEGGAFGGDGGLEGGDQSWEVWYLPVDVRGVCVRGEETGEGERGVFV